MSLPLAVNVAVLDGSGRLLMTQREDFEVWCLPGGHVDEGESLGAAAVREVLEETGLHVSLDRLVGLYSRPRWGGYHTAVVFAASPVGGALRAQPDEVRELGFFAPESLPEPLLRGHAERIHDVLAGHGGSVVKTHDVFRPAAMPTDRSALYESRDASESPRAEFYAQLVAELGLDESRSELTSRRLPFNP